METENKGMPLDEKGFVFTIRGRPHWCRLYGGNAWLFKLSRSRRWVASRPVTAADIESYPHNLPEDEQEAYRRLIL